MAIENGIITGAVSISDVQQVLGVTSSDLATLCTHEKINEWSFNKPVRHSNPFASLKVDGWQQGKGSQEGYLDDVTCGLLVGNAHQTLFGGSESIKDRVTDISKDTNGFLYKLAKGTTGNWVYQRPEGADKGSWFRLDDFRGYNHSAVNPMPSVKMPSDGIYRYQSGQFDVELDLPTISLESSLTNVTLDSLKLPSSMVGMTLRNMYYGVLLYSDDLTDVLWVTQTAEQKDKESSTSGYTPRVTFTEGDKLYVLISGRKGVYNARAFFCTQPLQCNNYNQPSGTIAFLLPSVDEPIKVAILDANLPLISLDLSIKDSPKGPVCVVTNNQPKAVTLSSCKFDTMKIGLYFEALTSPVTIEPFGHYTVSVKASSSTSFKVQVVVDGVTYEGEY